MVKGLGRKVSAQALANFCFVEITDEEDGKLDQFGVLNFLAFNKEVRVGYIWLGGEDKADKSMLEPGKYIAKAASDESFEPLKLKYLKALNHAFNKINSNTPSNVEKEYDENRRKYPFEIPKIINKTNEEKNIIVYV
jgi:hypothetical protein